MKDKKDTPKKAQVAKPSRMYHVHTQANKLRRIAKDKAKKAKAERKAFERKQSLLAHSTPCVDNPLVEAP